MSYLSQGPAPMALPQLAILDGIINQGLILGNQLEGQVVAMLQQITEEEAQAHMANIALINNLNNGGEVEEQFEEEGEFIQDAAEVNPFGQGEDALPGGFRMRPGDNNEGQERNRRCFRYSNKFSETETDSNTEDFVRGQSRKWEREEEDDDGDEMGGKKAKRS